MKKKTLIAGFLILTVFGILYATTWHEKEVICPVCETKNKFQGISSYGSYIYNWPSKFQYIYWPVTESAAFYSCKECRYTALMWDFQSVSGDTLELIKSAIDTLPITMEAQDDYLSIPITQKLETAEMFYRLYETGEDTWCDFYRIMGYHYDRSRLVDKADEKRLLALEIANSQLEDSSNGYRNKELLLITASMKHFTNNDSGAMKDIELAQTLRFNDAELDSTRNANFNEYLDALLMDFVQKIENPDD